MRISLYLISFFAIGMMLFSGCATDPLTGEESGMGSSTIKPYTLKLNSGQKLEIFPYDNVKEWLESHKNITIVSFAPIDRAGHGFTNGFVVVYTENTITVEKTIKEIALEKLTDEEKKALGVK